MTRFLVTGATGQLGKQILEMKPRGSEVTVAGRKNSIRSRNFYQMDLGAPFTAYSSVINSRPDVVIHAGALTDVDLCEKEREYANLVNAKSTGEIAKACSEIGCRMVHVSTDYVFDGSKGKYTETDNVRPIQVYGQTKLEGEELSRSHMHGEKLLTIRTGVVFSMEEGFVGWLNESMESNKEIGVVSDQWVSPTNSRYLADTIFKLISLDASGVWNVASCDRTSRFEMAEEIRKRRGAERRLLVPKSMNEMSWLAPRPEDSSLDCSKLKSVGIEMSFNQMLDALVYGE